MHAPDGFLNAGTAVATGAISFATVGAALRQMGRGLADRQVPLAGVAAAFIFAAQMVNFPVAAGTTGHLLGGALAAVLLGPAAATVVVTVVVVVQAIAFADGGLTALGINVLNMAVVPAFGGYAVFRLFRKVLPRTPGGVVGATGLAAGLSVVFSAMAFSIQWLFGATAPVPFDTVFGAMVTVHLLIGVGEAVISALAVGAVLSVRPDLVRGADHLQRAELTGRRSVSMRTFVFGAAAVAIVIATVVSQFAAEAPDGLERVAADTGIVGTDHALDGWLFADYATDGVDNPGLSLAVAGAAGIVVTTALVAGIGFAVRERRSEPERV